MAKRHKKSHKKCIVSSGPKKGKLKKGWRLSKRAGCVQAKGKKSRKTRRSRRRSR